jgi:hypothetical protein
LQEVEHTPPVHKRILDLLPGVSGGVARVMVGQPFDTIKTRMQVLGKGTIGAQGMPPDMVYNSGMDCVRKMVSAQGLAGWRREGVVVAQLRVPSHAQSVRLRVCCDGLASNLAASTCAAPAYQLL